MSKIKFLEDKKTYPNGVDLKEFKKGEEVSDLPADLAGAFIAQGIAEEVKTRETKPAALKKEAKVEPKVEKPKLIRRSKKSNDEG